jgi:hypothetical protein
MMMIVDKVEENEDGSATLTLDIELEQAELLKELGLRLVLYCLVADKTTEEVFKWLEGHIE